MNDLLTTICSTIGLNIVSNVIYDFSKKIGFYFLPHQKNNLIKWLEIWQPSNKDIEIINSNEQIKRNISIIFGSVQNELFEEKIIRWGIIADNVIRGKETEINDELYFIQLFNQIPIRTLELLFKIRTNEKLSTTDIYPEGFPPPENSISEKNYRAYVFASTHGLVTIHNQNTVLTGFGKRFLDFIGDKYQERVAL